MSARNRRRAGQGVRAPHSCATQNFPALGSVLEFSAVATHPFVNRTMAT